MDHFYDVCTSIQTSSSNIKNENKNLSVKFSKIDDNNYQNSTASKSKNRTSITTGKLTDSYFTCILSIETISQISRLSIALISTLNVSHFNYGVLNLKLWLCAFGFLATAKDEYNSYNIPISFVVCLWFFFYIIMTWHKSQSHYGIMSRKCQQKYNRNTIFMGAIADDSCPFVLAQE